MKEIICPLLTTNTVVDEDNNIKIGTQPVYCLQEQCLSTPPLFLLRNPLPFPCLLVHTVLTGSRQS